MFGALAVSPAGAQDAPSSTTTPTEPTEPTEPSTGTDAAATTTTMPTPTASTAGPGVYGAPMWLPLRRELPGSEVIVGCTYDSHGSAHGYECSGHHDRWAIDFIADSGTPVYAAGAGFATDLTGQPGGSGFGNVVRIDHGFGISTVYAHLTEVMVPADGTWVDETTQIGTVGATGSASTAHLHYERFSIPTLDTDIGDQVSIDPGPLFACRGDLLVAFPHVAGHDTWKNLAWGSLTVASDGTDCLDTTADTAAPTQPATPVPAPETGPTSWADLIAPAVDAVADTAEALTT